MEENSTDHLEEFLKMMKEQDNKADENLNKPLFDDICKTAELFEITENETDRNEIIENLRNRFKNIDLNEVTDLFIYSQSFLSTNENPVPMPSIMCIAIGKLFTDKNLHYTASKVYSENEIEGGCALSFLGYLALKEHHTTYFLNFIKNNFEGFSKNKKTECVFQLKELFSDNEIAKQIIDESGITEYELVFSTEEDSSSKPITFKMTIEDDNITSEPTTKKKISSGNITNEIKPKIKKPWWKFWEKE